MPMDYEWENKQGPVDSRSPFMNISNNNNHNNININNTTNNPFRKRKLSTSSPAHDKMVTPGPCFKSLMKSGPHSVLESPSKTGFATPNRPQLREPNSQHYLFTQPNLKPLPAVPSHVQESSLWEPRTPTSVIDFSSGGETPSTPLYEDSEATPDTGLRNRMNNMFTNGGNGKAKGSPKKLGRRDSWLGALLGKSPGKDSRGYSSKAENRVMKRRQKKASTRQEDDDISDDEQPSSRRSRKKESTNNSQDSNPPPAPPTGSSIGAFFSFLETHPGLPHILSWYAQLFLNLFLVFSAMYILYAFWNAITAEVDVQARKSMSDIMHEIAICTHEYRINNCAVARVPALENACRNWEQCMQRDPNKIARASVTAKTFAMIFNSFVEEFSYKSMVSVISLIVCWRWTSPSTPAAASRLQHL